MSTVDSIPDRQAPPRPRAGTTQAGLVNILHDYRVNLEMLQSAWRSAAGAAATVQAVEAARTAETVANRVAHALDAVDDALTRVDCIARQTVHPKRVQESIEHMTQHRATLLVDLTTAVDEVGEVYAKVLELSTTMNPHGIRAAEMSEAARASQSLDVLRGVFAELDSIDLPSRSGKPSEQE